MRFLIQFALVTILASSLHAGNPQATARQLAMQDSTELLNGSLSGGVGDFFAPGLWIFRNGPGDINMQLRGRTGSDLLVELYGIPVNPGFQQQTRHLLPSVLLVQSFDVIEVTNGVAAAGSGNEALGGIISIKNLAPAFSEARKMSGKFESRANFGGTDRVNGSGTVSFHSKKAALTVFGSALQQSKYVVPASSDPNLWFPYRASTLPADVQAFSFGFHSAFRTNGAQDRLEVSAFTSELSNAPSIDRMTMGYSYQYEPAIPYPEDGFASQTDPAGIRFMRMAYIVEDLTEAVEDLTVSFANHEIYETGSFTEFDRTPVFGLDDRYFTLSDLQRTDRAESNTVTFKVESRVRLRPDRIIQAGVMHNRETLSASHGVYGPDGLITPVQTLVPDGSMVRRTSAWVNGNLIKTTTWTVQAGLNAHYTKTMANFEGVRDPLARGLNPKTFHFFGIAGNVKALNQINTKSSVYLQVSSGYRNPNVYDLTALGPKQDRTYVRAGSAYGNERLSNGEAGFTYSDGVLSMKSVVFTSVGHRRFSYRRTGRLLDFEGNLLPVSDVAPAPGEFAEVILENQGAFIISGLELDGKFKTSTWSEIYFAFTAMEGRRLKNPDSGALDRMPPVFGRAGAVFRPFRRFEIKPSFFIAGSKNDYPFAEYFDSRINPSGTSGFVVTNISTTYQIRKNARLTVQAGNLFDEVYREFGSAIDGPARTITAAVQVRF